MLDAARLQRQTKLEAVNDFRGLLEAASPTGTNLPLGVPNTVKIGRRLQALDGRTVDSNGLTLRLRMEAMRNNTNRYCVEVLSSSAGAAAPSAGATAQSAESASAAQANGAAGDRPQPSEAEMLAIIGAAMAEDAADSMVH